MPATESTMLTLGTTAPSFQLPDVTDGQTISLETFAGKKALLVAFISARCPFVLHIKDELAKLGGDYAPQGVGIVAVGSNAVIVSPEDSPEHLKAFAAQLDLNFPVVYDETQAVAKAYKAACTPDFFLFDNSLRLVYRGQLDSSRPKNDQPVTGSDLRAALEAVLAGKDVSPAQRPSIGCNIKWRPGNEPPYFAS